MTLPLTRPRPPRVPFVRPVHVCPATGAEPQWLLASNLSEGGLFIRSSEPLTVGTRLRLELEARGQPLEFADGEVIWSRPLDPVRLDQGLPGFGVRFEPLYPGAEALVKHLVDAGGTGRGQAKTVAFGADDAEKMPLREPLHAPASAMVQALPPAEIPTDGPHRALTLTDIDSIASAEAQLERKMVIDLGQDPDELGSAAPVDSSEPAVDAAALRAHAEAVPVAPARRLGSSRPASLLAGFALCSAVVGAAIFAWRGFHEALAPVPETVASAAPATSEAPTASPKVVDAEADDDAETPTAPEQVKAAPAAPVAAAKPEALPEAKPAPAVAEVAPASSKPRPAVDLHALAHKLAQPTPPAVVAAAPAPVAAKPVAHVAPIALPSGAARAVAVVEQGGALQIQPELAPGSSIEHVFTLAAPARLVIDLKGPTPHGAPRVAGRAAVTSVRLGARPGGTRLVLDLARPASKIESQNGQIRVELQ